jgi:hypothetical protein
MNQVICKKKNLCRQPKKLDANEQMAYENLLSEYVAKIKGGELSSYRASKLSREYYEFLNLILIS